MKKTYLGIMLGIAVTALLIGGCGGSSTSGNIENNIEAGDSKIEENEEPRQDDIPEEKKEEEETKAEPVEEAGSEAEDETSTGRKDGERFEDVIMLEGMEETVRYEHVINKKIGFEMDYDYESFERYTEAGSERFISVYDDPKNPESFLEVKFSREDPDSVYESIKSQSNGLEITEKESYDFDLAGSGIMFYINDDDGDFQASDPLQEVFIIPAGDGSLIATAHYTVEGQEGFGSRFAYIVNTIVVIDREEEKPVSDEQALNAIKKYCYLNYPDLEDVINEDKATVYWDISSSDDKEIVVLFRSYTGALVRYYIDPVSGDTYVTEFVEGITPAEERTDESFNVRDYL